MPTNRAVRRLVMRRRSSAIVGYQGPGDVSGYSSVYEYWGLRAFNATKAAALTALIDIEDSVGTNPATINCLSSGNIDATTLSAYIVAHGTAYVRKLYGQVNGIHMVPGALALPRITSVNGLATNKPSIVFDGSQEFLIANALSTATPQPITIAAIVKFTFVSTGDLFSDGEVGFQLQNDLSADLLLYAGTVQSSSTVADSSWGSMQAVYNGASSSINSANSGTNPSGSPTTLGGSVGTQGFLNTNKLTIGSRLDSGASLPFKGEVFELMALGSAVSSGNQSSQVANQRAYGGF